MAEYITTPSTDAGVSASGVDALDSSQSDRDTPSTKGGMALPFPNSDIAPSVSAGPIGPHALLSLCSWTCATPGCLEVFETRALLVKHASSARHKPYRCKCGHEASSKWVIDYHIREAKRKAFRNIVHVRAPLEEPHTCAVEGCRRVFTNGRKLEEHAKVTGHKAFQCVCSRGFSQLYSLGRHVDESHKDEAGKYKCPLEGKWWKKGNCESSFKRLGHLEQHLRAQGPFDHRQTVEEVKLLLLPFRKRKPTVSKPAARVTSSVALPVSTPHDKSSQTPESDATISETSVGENAAGAQRAFLAVTMGALPPIQDAHTMMPTAGPDFGHGDFQTAPFDSTAWPAAAGGYAPTTSIPSVQLPVWSNDFGFYAAPASGNFGFPGAINGYSSQSVHGGLPTPLTTAPRNGYTLPAPSFMAASSMNNPAAWASPFGQAPIDGFGMQYNTPSMAPGYGSFSNPAGAFNAVPPMQPSSLHPTDFALDLTNDLSPTAGVMMANPSGHRGSTIAGNYEASMFTHAGFNNRAYMEPHNAFMAQDPFNNVDFPEDMDLGDVGMDFKGAGF